MVYSILRYFKAMEHVYNCYFGELGGLLVKPHLPALR